MERHDLTVARCTPPTTRCFGPFGCPLIALDFDMSESMARTSSDEEKYGALATA